MSILRGAAWMVTFKFIDRGLGMVSIIILARLLLPADFGLVAMAMTVIALLELLGAFGFEVALIQNQTAGREHYDTAWTFNVMFGILYAVLLVAVAGPAAALYEEPRLETILPALGLASLVRGFENVGVVDFRKKMLFRQDFRFMMGKRMVAFVVTIVFALAFRNYWALVIGTIAGRVAGLVLSYIVHPFRPRFSVQAGRQLFNFSKWILLNNLIGFCHSRSVDLLLGKFGGAHPLGVYSIGAEIGRLPTTELVAPINRAAFPGYSMVAADRVKLGAEFRKTIGVIMLLAIPAGVGLCMVAESAVWVMLGEKWIEAIPIIRIVAIACVIAVLKSNMATVIFATGRIRLTTVIEILLLILYLPMATWGVHEYGAVGAAWALLAASVLTAPINLYIFSRGTGLELTPLIHELWRPITAAVTMALVLWAVDVTLNVSGGAAEHLVQLVTLVAIGALTYAVVVWVLWNWVGRPDSAEHVATENTFALINKVRQMWQSSLGGR